MSQSICIWCKRPVAVERCEDFLVLVRHDRPDEHRPCEGTGVVVYEIAIPVTTTGGSDDNA